MNGEPHAVNADVGLTTPEDRFNAWLAEQEARDGPLRPGRPSKALTFRDIVPPVIKLATWLLLGWSVLRAIFGW